MARVYIRILLVTFVSWVPTSAFSQTPTAGDVERSIVGVVLDQSGAAVPGAEVTATDPAGRQVLATTDGSGRFEVRVGSARHVTLAVLVHGFAPAIQPDVDGSRVVTVTVQPATVQEHVDVVSPARPS